jgi:hypothetical protein
MHEINRRQTPVLNGQGLQVLESRQSPDFEDIDLNIHSP